MKERILEDVIFAFLFEKAYCPVRYSNPFFPFFLNLFASPPLECRIVGKTSELLIVLK